jgi:S1-C subfamily serine protease
VVAIGNVELGIGGDLIVAIDGKAVDREDALVRAVSLRRVGDTINLTVYRNGAALNVPVKLLRPPPDMG